MPLKDSASYTLGYKFSQIFRLFVYCLTGESLAAECSSLNYNLLMSVARCLLRFKDKTAKKGEGGGFDLHKSLNF